jgi:hypothetical protein
MACGAVCNDGPRKAPQQQVQMRSIAGLPSHRFRAGSAHPHDTSRPATLASAASPRCSCASIPARPARQRGRLFFSPIVSINPNNSQCALAVEHSVTRITCAAAFSAAALATSISYRCRSCQGRTSKPSDGRPVRVYYGRATRRILAFSHGRAATHRAIAISDCSNCSFAEPTPKFSGSAAMSASAAHQAHNCQPVVLSVTIACRSSTGAAHLLRCTLAALRRSRSGLAATPATQVMTRSAGPALLRHALCKLKCPWMAPRRAAAALPP